MNIINLVIGLVQQNWLDILVILIVLAFLLILWKLNKKDLVKFIVTELVCRAEQLYGSGSGQLKLAAVWASLYDRLPLIVRLFFTKAELQGYIEEAVDWLRKQLLKNDKFLLSHVDEKILK